MFVNDLFSTSALNCGIVCLDSVCANIFIFYEISCRERLSSLATVNCSTVMRSEEKMRAWKCDE